MGISSIVLFTFLIQFIWLVFRVYDRHKRIIVVRWFQSAEPF